MLPRTDNHLAILACSIQALLGSFQRLSDDFELAWPLPAEQTPPRDRTDALVADQTLEILADCGLDNRIVESLRDDILESAAQCARPLVALPKGSYGVEVFYLTVVLAGTTEVDRIAADSHVDLAFLHLDKLRSMVREDLQRDYGLNPASPSFLAHEAVVAAGVFAAWLSQRLLTELASVRRVADPSTPIGSERARATAERDWQSRRVRRLHSGDIYGDPGPDYGRPMAPSAPYPG